MNQETFSAREALALLGTQVRSCSNHEQLPPGAQGRVVRIRMDHRVKGFCIAVQWDDPISKDHDEFTKLEFQRFLTVSRNTA